MYFLVFIFGAAIGSFVNVIVDRLHVAPIVKARSKCLSCSKELSWYELIPVVSFVLQKGKCRNCGASYGVQHLIVELAYGGLFVLLLSFLVSDTFITTATAGWFVYYTILFVVSGVLVLYDLRHKVIPSSFLYAFIVLSFIMLCVRYSATHEAAEFIAPFVLSLPFLLLYFVTKRRGVGLGDVILFSAVGMLLGVDQGVASFMIAIWSGALIGVALQIHNRQKFTRKYALPFVPFIIFGVLVALFTDISATAILNFFS